MIGNYVQGPLLADPSRGGVSFHGILAAFGINSTVKYNRVEGVAAAIVMKSKGGDFTSGGVFYNIVKNCIEGGYVRRANDVHWENNTFVNITSRFVTMDDQGYANVCRGCVFKNNLFHGTPSNQLFLVQEAALDGTNDVLFENNVYDVTTTNPFITTYTSATNYTLAEAITNGWSIDDNVDDIDFTNLATGDLTLQAGSIGIGDGLTLTDNDGLDSSSNWRIPNTLPALNPSIVTKEQSVAWDRGAYVS